LKNSETLANEATIAAEEQEGTSYKKIRSQCAMDTRRRRPIRQYNWHNEYEYSTKQKRATKNTKQLNEATFGQTKRRRI
jgi:hypothetical protein